MAVLSFTNPAPLLPLDRNGILCNNVIELIANVYTIFTVLEMNPDPDYDPDANKSHWELFWKDVAKMFAEFMAWYSEIPWYNKAILGTMLIVVAVALTILSKGSLIPLFITLGTSVATSVYCGMDAAGYDNLLEGALNGLGDGLLWGGVFAAFGAAGRTYKYYTDPIFRHDENVKYILRKMTKGRFRKTVLLGKEYGVETPYYKLAKIEKSTYFYNKNYNKLVKKFGEELMNEANLKFLYNQMASGKHIIFVHDIFTGAYKMEYNYVTKVNGYAYISFLHKL